MAIYKTAPQDFKKELEVVGCFVECGSEFLLLHRQLHKVNGGTWGMPAGKIDAGESMVAAMCRELREETGIQLGDGEITFFDSVFVRNAGLDFMYHMFTAQFDAKPEVRINPAEHQDHMWVTPAESGTLALIHDLDLCIDMYYRK